MGNLAQTLREYGQGVGETALSLGSGMAAQIPAGVAGILEFLRSQNVDRAGAGKSMERAADKTNEIAERYTYEPRGDTGRRGLENIGHAIEAVTDPVKDVTVDPIGDRSPALGAAILAGVNMIGPKGAKRPKPHTPRFDPGSPQQLIPGVEPITASQAHARAMRELTEAREGMNFEDLNSGLQFDFDPNWRGGGPTYEMNYREPSSQRAGGKREVSAISQRPITLASLEGPSSRTVPARENYVSENTVQAEVGAENFQRMMALAERLRNAEGEARTMGNESMLTNARDLNQQISRRRALAAEPSINPQQRLQLEEEILNLSRRRPMDVGGGDRMRMVSPQPNPAEGPFSPMRWFDTKGDEATAAAREYLRERPGYLDVQKRTVRRLRGEPEDYGTQPRAPAAPRLQLEEVGGRDPDAMNREAVAGFLHEAQNVDPMFQFGVMPPKSVRSLDDFAAHFSEKANEPINVDWEYARNEDEPYKIEREKTHGRGEVMRDRHGDYKGEGETHEAGNYPMYDYRGDLKEVEAKGPTKDGEPLMRKKVAEGGETKFDTYGDNEFIYKKSRGGEVMRDERGRTKYEEVENPDYSDSDVDQATIRGPSGKIVVTYGDPATIHASDARAKDKSKAAKGHGGQLLYQVAAAHASRNRIPITGESLTPINQYRLLSNSLSNYARSGVNTRDVMGTLSGRARRARGPAEGPELWRAEAEEARSRLLQSGTDPDRVTFHPENGFSIDGKPARPEDIKAKMADLSPRAGTGHETGGVGQKSLMRNAVFEWLRHASPEDAKRVAAKWPKDWGPIFTGIGAAALGLKSLPDGEEQRAD